MNSLSPIALAPLAALYGAVTRSRLALYRRNVLKASELKKPVISVGNITTGGTGKTPLVEFIARALAAEGIEVCVLTRGYGRKKAGRVLVSDGHNVLASEHDAGDEPRLLAESLRGIAAVISDADRTAAGAWAEEELGAQVFILDDGFQHLRLKRNLNVAIVDATSPWGQGHLLPWGRLREPRRELSRADCVVITRADQIAQVNTLREEICSLIPNKPVFTSRMRVRGFRAIGDNPSIELEGPAIESAQPVVAFCGIGNPAAFLTQLQGAGYGLAGTSVFPDHYRYSQNDLNQIVRKAKEAGARSLITTAKDAVKLGEFAFDLPCYALEIEISIDNEAQFLELVYSAGGGGGLSVDVGRGEGNG